MTARLPRLVPLAALALSGSLAACDSDAAIKKGIESIVLGPQPDELPVMLNKELPFRYPPDLYARKVQGNVTLHIFIDSLGAIRPESTWVMKSSGHPGLDSAAITGSAELRFIPAKKNGAPLAIPVQFPVHFRHPDGPPFPADSGAPAPDSGRKQP